MEPTMISLKVLSTAAAMALVLPMVVPSESFAQNPYAGRSAGNVRAGVGGGGGARMGNAGVRMGIMMGPMIPGLNEHEMQRIMKEAKDNGATFTAYTFIRLNGAIKLLFHDWLYKNFPDRADKVWHMIEAGHDGQVNDSRFGVRMRGEGQIAELVRQQYKKYGKLYGLNAERWELDCTQFRRPGEQGKLF